jgi:hypothetical protein
MFVDPDRRGLRQAVGLAGDPAGLPGRHLQPTNTFPQHREAVAQVEADRVEVADLVLPCRTVVLMDWVKHRPPTLELLRTPCPQGENRS